MRDLFSSDVDALIVDDRAVYERVCELVSLRLPELGYSILSACSESVKDGSTLVYSTCTVSKDENEKVIERFLSEHTDFAPEGFSVGGITSDGVCVLLPCDYGTDGFFIAKMRKIK